MLTEVTRKVLGKMALQVVRHVTKQIILKLLEQIIKVKVEVIGPCSMGEGIMASGSSHIIFFSFLGI